MTLSRDGVLKAPCLRQGGNVSKKALAMLGLVVVGVVTGGLAVNALAIVGIEGKVGIDTMNAILLGMDVAAALAVFGGVTSIAGFALFLLKKALQKASKKAILA